MSTFGAQSKAFLRKMSDNSSSIPASHEKCVNCKYLDGPTRPHVAPDQIAWTVWAFIKQTNPMISKLSTKLTRWNSTERVCRICSSILHRSFGCKTACMGGYSGEHWSRESGMEYPWRQSGSPKSSRIVCPWPSFAFAAKPRWTHWDDRAWSIGPLRTQSCRWYVFVYGLFKS